MAEPFGQQQQQQGVGTGGLPPVKTVAQALEDEEREREQAGGSGIPAPGTGTEVPGSFPVPGHMRDPEEAHQGQGAGGLPGDEPMESIPSGPETPVEPAFQHPELLPGFGEGAASIDESAAPDPLDERFEQLLKDHEAGWESIREQVLDQGAIEARRFSEQAAEAGFSAGGYMSGGQAELALGRIQALANAKAAHETQKTELQLAWLDKRVTQDFQREINAEQTRHQLLFSILESGEPMTKDQLDALIGAGVISEGVGEGMSGGETTPEGVTYYQDEDGEWYHEGADGEKVYWTGDAGTPGGTENLYDPATMGDEGAGSSVLQQGYEADGSFATITAEGGEPADYTSEVEPLVENLARDLGEEPGQFKKKPHILGEAGMFVSKYKAENGGNLPSVAELRRHLRATGYIN